MGKLTVEITGVVHKIGEVQTFGSGFQKTELLLNVEDGKYTQCLKLEFVGDKHDLPQSVNVGQEVTVTADIRGREYQDTAFNSLQAWKMIAVEGSAQPSEESQAADVPESQGEFEDSIPF